MDGVTARTRSETASAAGVSPWRDVGLLLLLLALAAGIRFWLVAHTEVAARDSIGFIRYALELEKKPWAEVLRESHQHPGYPVLLMLVSWPVRQAHGATDAFALQLSAQLASSLCGILLVIPMYFLGRELFGRGVGFWAAALFQCLPVSGRVLSDALSESAFLLFVAAALWLAVRSLRRQSVPGFALAGLGAGLAYLTRPEGLLAAGATGVVLLATLVVPAWRRPWRRTLVCATSLTLAFLATALPYVAVIGHITVKPTGKDLVRETFALREAPPEDEQARGAATLPLAVWLTEREKNNWLLRLGGIGEELIQCFHYVAWLPALLGLWWYRQRLGAVPDAWPVLLLVGLHTLLLWRLAGVGGYVSERHLLLVVMCGCFWAAAGTIAIGCRLSRLGRWLPALGARPARLVAGSLLLALAASGLPKTLKPLHSNRVGHHQVGLWLAANTRPADPILDPFCWAHYYAGRVFWEGREPPRPPNYRPTLYVVVEPPSREHARLPLVPRAREAARRGPVVYHWPADGPQERARVLVHAVPLAEAPQQ